MLVLARKPGEAIVLDGGIRIVVMRSGGSCVKIGIEAPQEVRIRREELLLRGDNFVEVPLPSLRLAGAIS